MQDQDDVLGFWFSEKNAPKRFVKDPEFDAEITHKFLTLYDKARRGELDHWQETAHGALALVILLDQFSRNMFRGSARSFEADKQALTIVRGAIDRKFDRDLDDEKCAFLYVPYMHAEDLQTQEEGIKLFAARGLGENERFAILHRDIIARFGRFPHRNEILGRESTQDEIEFLKTPGSSF